MTDDPLRAALEAVLRRDDLCDDTDGEHHTDEYVAAFLNALDTELAGRAALAASATDEGPNPCIVCGYPASAVVTVCAHHREGLEHPDRVTASKCARCGRTRALAPDGTCWECAVEYRDAILDGQRARPAVPALDAIDITRLTAVLWGMDLHGNAALWGFDASALAERIAREYAALHSKEPTDAP